jgi:hypothetical protein
MVRFLHTNDRQLASPRHFIADGSWEHDTQRDTTRFMSRYAPPQKENASLCWWHTVFESDSVGQ